MIRPFRIVAPCETKTEFSELKTIVHIASTGMYMRELPKPRQEVE